MIQSRPLYGMFLLAVLPLVGGCGLGTRFLFSTSHDVLATPDQRGMPYEDVRFSAEDGVQLHGWLIPGSPEKPLVLFCHGDAANITYRVENLRYLHDLGFSVFIFDYRGFGASAGEATSEEDLRRDARGALAWLEGRGWPPSRLIFYGRSLGAAVALALALETPPAGVVLEAPFTSLAEIAWHLSPFSYALFGWWSLDARFDNIDAIGRLGAPLLIFHGTRDPIIPPEMSLRLFARAPEPKTLCLVPGGGHSNAYLAGGEMYRQAWLRFAAAPSIARHLSPAPGRHFAGRGEER